MTILIIYAVSVCIVILAMLTGFVSYRLFKAFFVRRSADLGDFAYSSANIKATWLAILVSMLSIWLLTAVSLGVVWLINLIK